MTPTLKLADCVPQNETAKCAAAKQIARVVRKAGLDYEGWRYVSKLVRKLCRLRPRRMGKKLPKILDSAGFRGLFALIDQEGDAQHQLMLRFFFFSGLRVSELCRLERADVDVEAGRVRVNGGKGDKDRVTLLPRSFLQALRVHLAAHPGWRWLFQTTRSGPFGPRRVQQIVQGYAARAGVKCTPHTLRHQFATWLTGESGLSDAELQLLTGHAKRESLAVYQHLALGPELEGKYQAAMQKADL